MKKHYSNLTLLTSNIFFTTLRCFILIILSFSSSQKTVAQIAKNNYLKAPFVNESISSTDLSTNTITNFQFLNGGSKLSFDIYSLRTSGTWRLGPSSYWVKYTSGMLINPVLTYMNPKFTIGSPTGSYNSASLFQISNKFALQINYNGGTGDLVSDIPGVTGFGEKIASIQFDIIQIFTNFQWDPLNSGINTTSNTYVPSTFNGSFVPPPAILIQPNGGENLYSGSIQNISWLSSLSINLKIELTANNGGAWSVISSSYPAASGSFAWTIPNLSSDHCKIKISDANNPSLYDVSDNNFTISPATLNTGLIAYYPFNGNTNDASANGYHGTNNGATLTSNIIGVNGRAYLFDGVDDFISIPDVDFTVLNNITVNCFINPSGYNETVFFCHAGTGDFDFLTTSNLIRFWIKLSNGVSYECSAPFTINQWIQVTGTWEKGNKMKLYLNGQFMSEVNIPNYGFVGDPFHSSSIGAFSKFQYPSEARPFSGKIDEVRFYNRALSPSEIQQLYNQESQIVINTPSISISPIQINPGGSVSITGQKFRANAQVKVNVTSSNSELVHNQTYTANSAGEFNANYSSNNNSSHGIYTVSAYDIATNQNAPNKIFEVIQPVENYYLSIVSPADTSIIPDSVDSKINVEWIDKMIPENGYTIVGSKRSYKYSVNYSFDDGNNWQPDSIIIAGTEFVNSIPLFRAQVNLDSLLNSRGGLNVKLRVTDLIKTYRYDNTTSYPVRLNNLTRANVNLIWDYSYPERTGSPIGACADGVSRFYIKISKVPGNTITGISIYLSDDINSTSERVLGKLTGASVTDHYSDEANYTSSTSFNENISRNDYWVWYVSPDDFNRYGASDDSKIERNVKLNVTVSYSTGLPEAKTINLKIIRQPLMLVHGFNSNHHVWDDFIRNKNINSLFKFYSTPDLDPKGTYDANAMLLLNYFQSETNHYQSFRYIINKARQAGYASNQVSYVCHSMGGCIVRAASQSHYFEDIINYNEGFVNRIITVDTPHDGSPLADLVVNFFDHIPNKAIIFAEFADNDLIRSTYRLDENYNVLPSFSVLNLQVKGYERYNFHNTYIPSYLIAGDFFPGTSSQFENIDWNTLNVGEMNKYINFLDFIFEITGKFAIRRFFYNTEDYDEVKNLLKNRSMNRIERALKLFNLSCNKYLVTENFLANSDFVVSVESQLAGTNRSNYNTFDHYNNDPNLLGVGHTLYNECTKDEIIANNIISHLNLPTTANYNFIQHIPSTLYNSPLAMNNSSVTFPKESDDAHELIISLPEDGKICYVDSLLSISFSLDNTDSLKYVSLSFQGEKYYDTSKSSLYNFNILVNSNDLDTCLIYANAVYISGDSIDISDAYKRIFVRSNYPVVDFKANNDFYFMINNEIITPEYKSVFTNGIYKGALNNISASVENPSIIMFNNSDKSFKALSNGGTYAIVSNGGQSDTIYFSVNGEIVSPGNTNLVYPVDQAYVPTSDLKFSWNNVDYAFNYNLEIAEDVNFQHIIYRNNNISDTITTASDIQDSVRYYWRVKAINSAGSGNWSAVRTFITYPLFNAHFYITVIHQGFYNESTNSLRKKDTVKAYLMSVNSHYNIIDSAYSIIDSILHQGLFNFINATNGTYYLKVKHRNSIETWSKTGGEIFNKYSTMYYDFTSSQSQAFGSNLIQIGSAWCIFSGDVNQDEVIDASDMSEVDNDAYNSVSGYVRTDLTGDDFVDAEDMSIVDNNAFNSVSVIRP